jgi:phosphatidylserine/phosphatidylglycerophosphate/cardiolipin synthase-like enzyme
LFFLVPVLFSYKLGASGQVFCLFDPEGSVRSLLRMRLYLLRIFLLCGLFFAALPLRAAEISTCFTPGQDCTGLIVDQLDRARMRVLVQAYGMTSEPIMQALAQARRRGVDVRVLLDKSNEQERYTAATFLLNQGVAVLIDDKVAIAHNKVMVIDDQHVITGSFNFTKAAQERNAENVLLIRQSPELAANYSQNWRNRASVSRPYDDFREKRR